METITIYPRVGIGESIDTEPGCQPWDATLLHHHEGDDTNPEPYIVIDQGKYGPRIMRGGTVTRNSYSGKLEYRR